MTLSPCHATAREEPDRAATGDVPADHELSSHGRCPSRLEAPSADAAATRSGRRS